ncbi:MAG: iron-sulfur cluster assembly scaffold protein [Dehalococcoidia bacterium]|nr:iron-sulfur cluster assembly scaffold protein [Dehalococcoidia bacterium]
MSGGDGALDQYWAALKATYQEAYSEVAADHMVFPRNTGEIIEHDAFGIINDEHDDIIAMWLKIDGGAITNASFTAEECVTCTASGSVVTELIRGKTLAEALRVTPDDVAADLGGLPEKDRHCAELAVNVLRMAVQDYQGQVAQTRV